MEARNTLNVVQLGIGFFFIFCAFNSQGFIEETVINSHADKGGNTTITRHDGYTSLSIIYGVFTISNFFAAPVVEFLGAKWAMVAGGAAYAAFQAGFLYLNAAYLFTSSALLGVGAAVIWTAQGAYLTANSTEQTASRHSGLFWAISQACLIVGGVFLYVVFKYGTTDKEHYTIADSTTQLIYLVFTIITMVGVAILAVLGSPSQTHGERLQRESPSEESGVFSPTPARSTQMEVLKSTIRLSTTTPMLLLAAASAYTGLELGFWSGIYPTCIASTLQLGSNTKTLLALNAILQGCGQAVSGFLFGILSTHTQRLGRVGVVAMGTLVHSAAYAVIFLNIPADAPLGNTTKVGLIAPSLTLALFAGFLLGFGDACWNTQIFAHIIHNYPTKSAPAFSLFKFFQSLLACAAFYYSKALPLHWHLLILAAGMVFGVVGFVLADRVHIERSPALNSTTSRHDD